MANEKFLENVENARANGKTIGLVQGSWDLFHLGHLRYLLKARELCDFLIIAMDSDEKIRRRKGNGRPIIPESERYEFIRLLNIADEIVVKPVNEPKWNLIKTVRPDVLVAIKENYTEEQIIQLKEFCEDVAILPRQSESSTSDKIRKITIASSRGQQIKGLDEKIGKAIEEFKVRIGYNESMGEPIIRLVENLKNSTDWFCPVSVGCYWNGEWHFGSNHLDFSIPMYDIENRTELHYRCIEHAEINLLKKLGEVKELTVPIYTTLFPCDDCMKVLNDKGVREIYYLEDHPDRNWSKRSHEFAEKHGIKTIQLFRNEELNNEVTYTPEEMLAFKYIYPPNARHQDQLDIMMNFEHKGIDPLAPEYIEQEILDTTNYWYISRNRFPYEGAEHQFLIVARNEVYTQEEITKEMWIELQEIFNRLTEQYDIPGGALCMRFGDPSLSGATLKRFHVHLIKPKMEEKTRFPIGGHAELKKGLYLKEDNEKK